MSSAFSICEAEEPQGYPAPVSDLSVGDGKEAVGDIGYLFERFLLSSDFEEILVVDEAIALIYKCFCWHKNWF